MDAPLPMPLGDAIAAATLPTPSGGIDEAASGDAAAQFGALLARARLTLDPSAEPTDSRVRDEARPTEPTASTETTPGAFDGLLFLANLAPAPTADSAEASEEVADPPQTQVRPVPSAIPVFAPLATLAAPTAQARIDASSASATPAIEVPAATVANPAYGRHEYAPKLQDDVSFAAHAPSTSDGAAPLPDEPRFATSEAPLPAVSSPAAGSRAEGTPPMAMTHVQPAPAAAHATPAAVSVAIDTPVHHAQWREEAAERIASLVTRGTERAELRLSPAELGPVEVRIHLSGSEASLAIVATHATTRDALEQALPMLRDLLSQQGLSLGEATVRDGRSEGDAPRSGGGHRATPGDAAAAEADVVRTATLPRRLVDVFA